MIKFVEFVGGQSDHDNAPECGKLLVTQTAISLKIQGLLESKPEAFEVALQASSCLLKIIQSNKQTLSALYRLKALSVLVAVIEKQQTIKPSGDVASVMNIYFKSRISVVLLLVSMIFGKGLTPLGIVFSR